MKSHAVRRIKSNKNLSTEIGKFLGIVDADNYVPTSEYPFIPLKSTETLFRALYLPIQVN